jgi:multicomponent K+:H+ antiporter subunit A
VVNVILVDFRGYDTFGEITVLGIAAHGRAGAAGRLAHAPPTADADGRPLDLCRAAAAAARAAAVVLPLALVVTLYIFWRGHNLPGGGFIAGLITAVALVLQFMAMGQVGPNCCCTRPAGAASCAGSASGWALPG